MKVTFEIEGERQLDRRLRNIGDGVKNFRPELKKCGDFMKDFFGGDVFDTEGKEIDEEWTPLNPYYKRWKKAHYPGKGILERTGKMRKSFKKKARKKKVTVWNAIQYFKFHQSRMPRKRLPRRVMMKLTNEIKDEIVSIIHTGLDHRLNDRLP